jgi:hypothetical protein
MSNKKSEECRTLKLFDAKTQRSLERYDIFIDYLTRHLPRVTSAVSKCYRIRSTLFMDRLTKAACMKQQFIEIMWETYLHEEAVKEHNEKWDKIEEEVKHGN